jgi:transposase
VTGIDIGSRQMHVCAPAAEEGRVEVRIFGTATAEILACAEWLKQVQVESVAMESTGVYWIPVLEILEGCGFETLLVDTRPLSRVPGRKTDVGDAAWIQTLHSHGLLTGCFRPSEQISQVRSLVRQKAVLVADRANWTRRMQKCLDQMNVRVHHAVSDAQGSTGMRVLRAIVAGERDPRKLAELRDAGCRKSQEQMAALLNGHWRADHLFNLEQSLRMYDTIAEQIGVYEREIQRQMQALTPAERAESKAPPLRSAAKRKAMKRRHVEEKRQALYRLAGVDLTTIDGVGTETADAVLSEYGVNMNRFASEKEFVALRNWRPGRPSLGESHSKSVENSNPHAPGRRSATRPCRWGKAPLLGGPTIVASPAGRDLPSPCLPPRARSLRSSTGCCAGGRPTSTSASRRTRSITRRNACALSPALPLNSDTSSSRIMTL